MSQSRTLERRDRVMKPERVIGLLCAVGLFFVGCTPKPQGPITSAFDGVYNGKGYNASPPDWDCPAVMPADPLTVSGGEASFDAFSGWVAPDGTAQLSAQEGTINGRFEGKDFQGLLQYKVRMSPRLGCAFTLKMVRAG